VCVCVRVWVYVCVCVCVCSNTGDDDIHLRPRLIGREWAKESEGVSWIDKIIGLFCKRAL